MWAYFAFYLVQLGITLLAVPYLSEGIIVALLGLCVALFSQIAPRQRNLNDALGMFLEELQKDRAQHIAHASALASQLERANRTVELLQGQLRQQASVILSLRERLVKHGIAEVPPDSLLAQKALTYEVEIIEDDEEDE